MKFYKGFLNNMKYDGAKYEGGYKSDYFDGLGTFTLGNGVVEVNNYRDGKLHGKFTTNYTNGDVKVQKFRNGKQYGVTSFTYKDGDKYVGNFKNFMRNGLGEYIIPMDPFDDKTSKNSR